MDMCTWVIFGDGTAEDHTWRRRVLLLLICAMSGAQVDQEADTAKNDIRPMLPFPRS
jgi:hypothetical protein